MNQTRPVNQQEAFAVFLSLLESAGLQAAMLSPEIAEPLASTAIILAQIFDQEIKKHQAQTPQIIARPAAAEKYGGFELVGETIYFCSYDGQRLPICRYSCPDVAIDRLFALNTFVGISVRRHDAPD